MTKDELKTILEKHSVWLKDAEGGERADLSDANLSGADLSGADLDYSCWPLWCGSLNVKADEAIVGQLLYHVLDLAKNSGVDVGECKRLLELANNSKPVTEHNCPRLEV
jgi:hypothetical protein